MVEPQAKRMHTAKKIFRGCGGSEGNTNELITVTCRWRNNIKHRNNASDVGVNHTNLSIYDLCL